MGEKKDGHEHDHSREDKKKPLTVVFKVEVHCQGCGSRITKAARGVSGVESAKVDWEKSKLSVIGDVDPLKLRDKLESKLKKKVELVSPLPAQEDDQKMENKKPEGDKKADEDNPNEQKKPPAAKAVLKLDLHCSGCVEKIHHILSKTEEVESISFDKRKDLVMVEGQSMDVESIRDVLEKKMKRVVEIVPPKKSDGEDDGGEGKETAEKKVEAAGDGAKQAEFNRMMMMPMPMPAHPGFSYGNGYGYSFGPAYPSYPVQNLPAPQIFSDENPNACSVI